MSTAVCDFRLTNEAQRTCARSFGTVKRQIGVVLGPFLVLSESAQFFNMASRPNHSPNSETSTACGDLVTQILAGWKSQSVTIAKPQEENRGRSEASETNLGGNANGKTKDAEQ